MKITIISKDLRKRLKEVMAESSQKNIPDDIQLQQVGKEVWMYRRYITKDKQRCCVKCCRFSNNVIEPLKKTVRFDMSTGGLFFEWLKWTEDISQFDFELNEDNVSADVNYFVETIAGGNPRKGHTHFTMDFVKEKEIIRETNDTIVSKEELKTMKNFVSTDITRQAMCKIYIDNGVMVATDSHVLKIKDVDSSHVGLVELDGTSCKEEDWKYPNYKMVLPTGYKRKLRLEKKGLAKILDSWSKQYDEHIPVKFDLEPSGELNLRIQDIDYSISVDVRLADQEKSEWGIRFGVKGRHFLRILKDKDLNGEFDLWYKDPQSALVIVQEHDIWMEMPIMI